MDTLKTVSVEIPECLLEHGDLGMWKYHKEAFEYCAKLVSSRILTIEKFRKPNFWLRLKSHNPRFDCLSLPMSGISLWLLKQHRPLLTGEQEALKTARLKILDTWMFYESTHTYNSPDHPSYDWDDTLYWDDLRETFISQLIRITASLNPDAVQPYYASTIGDLYEQGVDEDLGDNACINPVDVSKWLET